MSLALSLACAQTLGAQTFVDLPPAAVAPAPADARRADEALRALRRRWRFAVEGGVAALSDITTTDDDGVVTWTSALTLALGVDARRAVSDLWEIHGRLEFLGPQTMTTVPSTLSAQVASVACAGSRSFDPLTGWGVQSSLSLGVRVRVFSLRSPFFVGAALRANLLAGATSGDAVAYCRASDGSARVLARVNESIAAALLDIGGTLETGFRFGAREEAELSLRLIAGGLGLGDPAVRGAVLTFGWSLR